VNRTETERGLDTDADTLLHPPAINPKEMNAEASWRSGYAADCKSPLKLPEIKGKTSNSYQDKAGTFPEPDTSSGICDISARASVALVEAAKAGRADACEAAIRTLRRLPGLQVATIAACAFFALDDDDAEDVIRGVLRRAGWPLPDALAPMHGARLWARDASRSERKAFALAAFEALGTDDQQAFLRFTGGLS